MVRKAVRSFKVMFICLIEHHISLDGVDVSCHSLARVTVTLVATLCTVLYCASATKEPVYASVPGQRCRLAGLVVSFGIRSHI